MGWEKKRTRLFLGVDHRPILAMTKLFEKPIGPSLEEVDVLEGQVEWHLLKSSKNKERERFRKNVPDPNLQLINSREILDIFNGQHKMRALSRTSIFLHLEISTKTQKAGWSLVVVD